MSAWDVAVFILAGLQVGTLVALLVAALKVKNGPVEGARRRAASLIVKGRRVFSAGQRAVQANRGGALALYEEVTGVVAGVKHGTRLDFGDAVSYRSLLSSWAQARSGLGLVNGVRAFLRRRKTAASPGPAASTAKGKTAARRRPPRPLLDRLGLLPPIARPLGHVLRYAAIARDVRRELRNRGLL